MGRTAYGQDTRGISAHRGVTVLLNYGTHKDRQQDQREAEIFAK
jgi:hypothetical protein